MEELLAAGLPGHGGRFRSLRVLLKGVLMKRGRFNVSFKGRLFVLTEDGSLHYLVSPSGHLFPGDKVHTYECTLKKSIHIGTNSAVRDGGLHGGMFLLHVHAPAAPAAAGLQGARRFELAAKDKETHALWLSTLLNVQALGLEPPPPPAATEEGEASQDQESDGSEQEPEDAGGVRYV